VLPPALTLLLDVAPPPVALVLAPPLPPAPLDERCAGPPQRAARRIVEARSVRRSSATREVRMAEARNTARASAQSTAPELHLARDGSGADQGLPRLWDGHVPQEVRLKPLSPKAAKHLVLGALEGKEGRDDETVARLILVELGDGNAFFLEELVPALAERGGVASSAQSIGEPFPDTVLAMVLARFDAFGPDDRRIVRRASVLGDV
jgi:hypothetical protein